MTRSRGNFHPLLLPLLLLLASGCASKGIQVDVQNRSEKYEQMPEPRTILCGTPPNCAVLPTVASSSNAGIATFTNVSFGYVVRNQIDDANVLFHAEVVNRLNQNSDGELLEKLLESIDPGDFLERTDLQQISESLNVEYFFLPRLVAVLTDNATRFSFAGLTFIRTGWTTVELGLQLWYAPTGQLIWQATGSATLVIENVVGNSPAIQTTLDTLLATMLDDFMNGRSESFLATDLPQPTAKNLTPLPTPTKAPELRPHSDSQTKSPTTDQP